ncbi:MAG: D-tyrosyl-tRNA(Tyr) deacylase [Holophagaceae bacterium]|uniref:D-aminoacyl-tRNA deacylase n=1 Tax=Candidatus Geothrix skivensis TaxID=2954439 RepID=A0A9D7SEE0_9BACT|nr:D-tyrosyl-tRNA(Tyr) deacylase [Candidatus Geothrix skivensis]
MKAVIQRVQRATVRCGEQSATIGPGLLVLAGLETGDTEATCAWVAAKIATLRIFEDGDGKMNLGLPETGGEILAISQFTLAGSLARGRRPSFDRAMEPEAARVLFQRFLDLLRAHYPRLKTGFFQEHMEVELVNDGPVTFILER